MSIFIYLFNKKILLFMNMNISQIEWFDYLNIYHKICWECQWYFINLTFSWKRRYTVLAAEGIRFDPFDITYQFAIHQVTLQCRTTIQQLIGSLLCLPSIEVETYCFTSHRSFVRPISFVSVRSLRLSCRRSNTRRWPNAQYWVTVSCLTPHWMWASVTDGRPTLTQLWFKASCR